MSDPSPPLSLTSAIELLRAGRSEEAEAASRVLLRHAPNQPDALSVLGASLHDQGKASEAVQVFEQLTRLQPGERRHWANLGTSLRLERRYEDSLAAFQRAARLGEASANFYYNLGLLHCDRQDFEAARAVLERATALAPQDAAIRVHYAQALQERMRPHDALAALQGWQQLEGLTSDVLTRLTGLLLNLGEPAQAAAALEGAREDPSPSRAAAMRIVEILERSNRLPEALGAFEQLRGAPPFGKSDQEEMRKVEAVLAQRTGKHEQARESLEALLAQCSDFHLRHFHLFRLARSLDALGRYEDAFEALTEAHRSQVVHFKLTQPEIALLGPAPMRITEHPCDPVDAAKWNHEGSPDLDASPIFVVGFPRSGTTLLELALDAHPDLASMDEQPFLQHAVDRLLKLGARYPHSLRDLTTQQLDEARAVYWGFVGRKVQLRHGERLVDKNPLNILRLAAIRRLFPASPVLFAVRHPCDVLLSCFMQHFSDADFALLCRDLPNLAIGYRRTFDFWYQQAGILGVRAHEVRYETLVADFESQIRAICDALSVRFAPEMLQPARHASTKAFISTPSYSQVVNPVHTKSVDRWRHYARHFGGALPLLAPYLQRWDYSGS